MHLGTWMDGKLRTLVGVADAEINLAFFGLGGDRMAGGNSLGYTVAARGGVAGASYRLGDSPFWLGLRYALAKTNVTFDVPGVTAPGIDAGDTQATVTSGGAGFRYLVARKHRLHVGLDFAVGPDEPNFYVVFGSGWLRP